ncbi:hypothetical protein Tco_0830499 [Tanacetum coccineum]
MILCAPFGIPFDPKRYYKDGDCTIMLWRPRYEGLEYTDSDIADFESRMVMEHRDEAGVVVFTSQDWGRFGEVLLDWDAPDTIQFQLGGARRRLRWRQFILALGLHTGEEMESPSFARDPVLRLCHRILAHSISGRSQALEKVTVTDLFYLRAQLAEHFGLLTDEILGGLTAWVAMGPEGQHDAAAGALGVVQDALIVDEGGQAILAPIQAP